MERKPKRRRKGQGWNLRWKEVSREWLWSGIRIQKGGPRNPVVAIGYWEITETKNIDGVQHYRRREERAIHARDTDDFCVDLYPLFQIASTAIESINCRLRDEVKKRYEKETGKKLKERW